jgi:hypothetical protein
MLIIILKFQKMKHLSLFLILAAITFTATQLQGQCVGGLTVSVTGSSTGGSVTTTVTTPPANQTILLGSSLTLTVAATGANLTYQWQKGGVDILNATSATYTKASAVASDAGAYTVVVHGDCGADVTSAVATVVVKGVLLNLKVVLEGSYNAVTGLMSDDLRSLGYLPTATPYGSMFTNIADITTVANTSIMTTTGNNAIADWVFVELRSKTNPATVLATRSALLQRNGDVVDTDGTSSLLLNVFPDNYYIAVRHRNHLAFRTIATLALSATPTIVDFRTLAVNTGGFYSRKTLGSLQLMYAGDANRDGSIDASDMDDHIRPQFGMIGANKTADFSLNGSVDADDLDLYFRINYGIINEID